MTNDPARRQETLSPASTEAEHLRGLLQGRHIVLVGLMGAGKTSVGRRLANKLSLPFVDSDHAIEESAMMSVPEIFALRGEDEFRAGERRVIARLLSEGQQVIATGGGAYMDAETRDRVRQKGVALWLNADLPTLMKRVQRRHDRPLLNTADPETTMRELMDRRYPIYGEADVAVQSMEVPHDQMVQKAIEAMIAVLEGRNRQKDQLREEQP